MKVQAFPLTTLSFWPASTVQATSDLPSRYPYSDSAGRIGVHPTEACAEHSGRFFEYCHIQNENLQCARTLSGTTNRVAFSTLKVHCLSASQHGSVSFGGSVSPPW
ncbi:hypothetical protein CA85_52330 [Allorhodopirellula solitaria]|uniref:Uncharacterized protein n=1 Tax=Allorhodopirellula solitaria TaxID=2527987 RepID=A0A5C5WLW0_9BACT|nr:hypothetical protein CA85_52330 [Allorhodopirellula solitaria]